MATPLKEFDKDCGDCTLCCYFMAIKKMDSPEYDYCKKCIPNKGCSIWKDRPNICRDTDCIWLKEKQIPQSFKPSKIGVMFERPNKCSVYIGHVDPERPDAWKEDGPQVFIQKIKEAGYSVIILSKDNSTIHYSLTPGDTIENVKKELEKSINHHKEKGLI